MPSNDVLHPAKGGGGDRTSTVDADTIEGRHFPIAVGLFHPPNVKCLRCSPVDADRKGSDTDRRRLSPRSFNALTMKHLSEMTYMSSWGREQAQSPVALLANGGVAIAEGGGAGVVASRRDCQVSASASWCKLRRYGAVPHVCNTRSIAVTCVQL